MLGKISKFKGQKAEEEELRKKDAEGDVDTQIFRRRMVVKSAAPGRFRASPALAHRHSYLRHLSSTILPIAFAFLAITNKTTVPYFQFFYILYYS